MDPTELDNALEELELRLERLRALYQQYFLGIEKIEPTVARKEIDRRIWALRRVQIRNTRRRFKLNVIIQRYNTFQQYWTRTCREIENGTYRHHVMRARRTVGELEPLTIAARKRLGLKPSQRRMQAAAEAEDAARELERELDATLDERLHPLDDIRRAMDEALGTSEPPGPRMGESLAEARIPPAPAVPSNSTADSSLSLEWGQDRETPRQPGPSRKPSRPASDTGGTSTPAAPRPSKQPLPAPRVRLSQGPRPPTSEPEAPRPRSAPSPGPEDAVSADTTSLSQQRVRQLHARLLDAKRQTKDSSTVSEEGLAKSLKAAEAKLRQQHGSDRRIEFDIVIKNGKAVVKPIVR